MSEWLTPPQFGHDGALPPVRSPLNALAPIFYGRLGPPVGRLATTALLEATPGADSEFYAVQLWLKENLNGAEYLGPGYEKRLRRGKRFAAGGGALLPFGPVFVGALAFGLAELYIGSRREILRIERSSFWERADPPTYLAPGSTSTVQTSYKSGLSATQYAELSTSLGLEASGKATPLISVKTSYNVTTKVGGSLTATTEKSVSRALQITNPTPDRDRCFAIWRPGQDVVVSVLKLVDGALAWSRLGRYDFLVDAEVATTSQEVPR
jgi:hypothetical protein